MNDRFKFNAVVSSWYDIDTPEDYQEFEPQFYIKNVDLFCTGEIGVDYDTLLDVVNKQAKNVTQKEIGQIMQHFEDNSNSPECDFVTIQPDKILQCTGLKDKNGKLIYEGDIVRFQYGNGYRIGAVEVDKCDWRISNSNFCQGAWCGGALICLYETCEIIGNIYENKELLEEECQK